MKNDFTKSEVFFISLCIYVIMDDYNDFFADINPLNTVSPVSDFFAPSPSEVIPDDCTMNVEYKDGKKEGAATVRTKKGILYAKLNYQDDLLNAEKGHLFTINKFLGEISKATASVKNTLKNSDIYSQIDSHHRII